MKLITNTKPNYCTAAAIAMVSNWDIEEVMANLFNDLEYPFDAPYERYPKVPCMDQICEFMWEECMQGLMPFNRAPTCSCGPACNEVDVWLDGEDRWMRHLGYGWGLLEGYVKKPNYTQDAVIPYINIGHMCAWDGQSVFDPRGYCYSWKRRETFGFDAERFWLVV